MDSIAKSSARRSSTKRGTSHRPYSSRAPSIASSRSSHHGGKREAAKQESSTQRVLDPDTQEDRTPSNLIASESMIRPSMKDLESGMASGRSSPSSMSDVSEWERITNLSFSRSEFQSRPGSATSRSDDGSVSLPGSPSFSELASDRGEEATESEDIDDDMKREEKEEEKEVLTEATLDSLVRVVLEETDTFYLLDMKASCVPQDSDVAETVRQENIHYKKLVDSRSGNERYQERGMQTFNNPVKTKDVQSLQMSFKEMSVGVTMWEIHDAYDEIEEGEEDMMDLPKVGPKETKQEGEEEGEEEEVEEDDWAAEFEDEGDGDVLPSSRSLDAGSKTKSNVLKDPALKEVLPFVERVVLHNLHAHKQMEFKGKLMEHDDEIDRFEKGDEKKEEEETKDEVLEMEPPDMLFDEGIVMAVEEDAQIRDEEEGKEESEEEQEIEPVVEGDAEQLFRFHCTPSKGKSVTAISWNPKNDGVIAAGYASSSTHQSDAGGDIFCWSIKNPCFPERSIKTKSGVTSLHFSKLHPSVLGAGLRDGTLAIFDIRKKGDEEVLKSSLDMGQHMDAVWEVQWVDKGSDRGEKLVSISGDGRVCEWSIKKGLERVDLMRLKRVANSTRKGAIKADAFISRHAGGLCFDFAPFDPNIYIAGTEDGDIHKCSCSYSEQYLENYFFHTGPVFRLRWSPFAPSYFLSASADWSLSLWHHERPSPLLTIHPAQDNVTEIAWSQQNATVFASLCSDGKTQIWDISKSVIDPFATITVPGTFMRSLAFSPFSSTIAVGDNQGSLRLWRLHGIEAPSPDRESEKDRLGELMKKEIR